jgi:hypothetical protein
MPDPIIIAAMVLLTALLEWTPRRLVPIGAVLAVGVVLSDERDGAVGVMALLGAVGIALASIGAAFAARRGRTRQGISPFAQAQRDALRARLSSSGTFARLAFVMAALPGPTSKILYPLLGAMRAPLLPAIAGTIIGRTIILSITTGLFTLVARAVSIDDSGAAEFLVTAIVVLVIWRLIGSIDWEHRAKHGTWRLRDPEANRMTGMFVGGMPGAGFDPRTGSSHAHARLNDDDDSHVLEGEIVEGDVLGEEIVDDHDDDADADQSRGS